MTDAPPDAPLLWHIPTDEDERAAPRVNSHTFWEAVRLALGTLEPDGRGAGPEPLADWVASDVPLTRDNRLMLADLIRLLPSRRLRGARGPGLRQQFASDSGAEAERQLARRIVQQQKVWCEQNPTRAGVPAKKVGEGVTEELIKGDIESGDSYWHRLWREQRDQSHRDQVVVNVLRLLRNKSRL